MKSLEIQQRFCDRSVPWAAWHCADGSRPYFAIGMPFDKHPHVPGNGQMVAFMARDRQMVAASYSVAMNQGGTDEGAPGLRSHYHEHYFGAYFRDTEGNKLCVACHQSE